jgi:hypothetical protein
LERLDVLMSGARVTRDASHLNGWHGSHVPTSDRRVCGGPPPRAA